jgi:hypothetical protein
MRQLLLGGFLSGLLLIVLGSGAAACINDREVGNSEREFKSHYKTNYQELPSIESPEPLKNQILAYGATGLGSVLLLGSALVTLKRSSL